MNGHFTLQLGVHWQSTEGTLRVQHFTMGAKQMTNIRHNRMGNTPRSHFAPLFYDFPSSKQFEVVWGSLGPQIVPNSWQLWLISLFCLQITRPFTKLSSGATIEQMLNSDWIWSVLPSQLGPLSLSESTGLHPAFTQSVLYNKIVNNRTKANVLS